MPPVDEAHRGDGLAGAGGVLEPEALVGVGVVDALGHVGVDVAGHLVLVGLGLGLLGPLVAAQLVVVELLDLVGHVIPGGLVDREHGRRGGRREVAVALGLGQQRGQRARQRVDLVRVERRAVGEARLVLAEHALEAEQQGVAPAPVGGRDLGARVDLRQGRVQRQSPPRARRERVRDGLAVVDESFAREALRTRDGVRIRDGCGRGGRRRGISHGPACC